MHIYYNYYNYNHYSRFIIIIIIIVRLRYATNYTPLTHSMPITIQPMPYYSFNILNGLFARSCYLRQYKVYIICRGLSVYSSLHFL